MKKYSVNDSIWLATALMALQVYTNNPDAPKSSYYFRQADIRKLAQTMTDGNVEPARVSWWVNADNEQHLQNYLRGDWEEKPKYRRLSMLDEFSEKTYPADLDEADEIANGDFAYTIGELLFFVREQYPVALGEIAGEFWPSLSEYNPNLFSTDYKKILLNEELIKREWLDVLYCLYKMGGAGTCAQISTQFGNTSAHYNSNAINIAKVIAQVCKCPLMKRENGEKMYWPILFYGREIPNQGQGVFEYKLRKPVSDAIREMEKLGAFEALNLADSFWPSLHEYDPGISTADYLNVYFPNPNIGQAHWLRALYELASMGETTTYQAAAQKYHNESQHYYNLVSRIDDEIEKASGVQNYMGKYWSLMFQVQNPDESRLVFRMRPELRGAIEQLAQTGKIGTVGDEAMKTPFDKNTILYGPPGTGKTYHTAHYAVAICDEEALEVVQNRPYSEVIARYRELEKEGRIAFTTFHQSFGYEEFIEGIRPVISENAEGLAYTLEDGIFKAFCKRASLPAPLQEKNLGLNSNPTVWKVSLGGTYDNPVRSECMEHGHIRIGWDQYGAELSEEKISEGRAILNAFTNGMRIGDLVLSCYSASTIDAVGVITGDSTWDDSFPEYKRVRPVRWLVKGINHNITELNGGKNMTLSTVYKMRIPAADVLSVVNQYAPKSPEKAANASARNHVFIIDEINRGNISKIFGELITLIEDTKREGLPEAASAILPYSGERFSVPQNVYILGTMNTADRSIAIMDTALRRRFRFEEMMPDYDALDGIYVGGLDVAKMLEVINERITFLFDREHTIGHSFFIPLRQNPDVKVLGAIFRKSMIPLLQEYFYEDYRKIQLVLGDNAKQDEYKFIKDSEIKIQNVFSGNVSDFIDLPESGFEINSSAFEKIESYYGISARLTK